MLIATAGHVDHGKTALVRALTGVDTDRLPEEKSRGLTIDLGFAYHPLDGGGVLGFVDVPGHERFIRNMIAGVPAIDYALLVVAADDGPMPQTVEHLAILGLLGVARGAIAVSKVDRVAAARVEEVGEAVHALARASVLEGAPLFPVSALAGSGLEALRAHLAREAAALPAREAAGGLRFAVDRAFSVHGAGLVVTGAVYAGRVAVGERLRVMPGGREVRVRGIEAAGHEQPSAQAGMRAALNLAGRGVDPRSVARGSWLVAPQAGPASERIDVWLEVLASEPAPLRQWTPVHVHHGAGFATGRVTLPGGGALAPGEAGFAQIVTAQALSAVHGERIVLRDTSGRRTVGGARVVDPYAPRRVRDRTARIAQLEALREPDPAAALAALLERSPDGVDPLAFAHGRNLDPAAMQRLAQACGATAADTPRGPRLVAPQAFAALVARLDAALAAHHEQHPDQVGPREAQLIGSVARGGARDLAAAALAQAVREGRVVRDGVALRLPAHRPALSPQDQVLWDRVARVLTADATKPPTVGDLAAGLELDRVLLLDFLERATRRGQLIRVAANRFLHPRAVARLAREAEALAGARGEAGFDARAYRDATGIGRNLTIDVLEYFDAMGLTRRAGDTRRVVRSSASLFGDAEPARTEAGNG